MSKAQPAAFSDATAQPTLPAEPFVPPAVPEAAIPRVRPRERVVPVPKRERVMDSRSQYRLVPVEDLHDDPDNPRKVYRNIGELSENLQAVGLLQPIVARVDPDKRLVIMFGHRRIRAARLARWSHVATIVRTDVADAGVLAQQLAENSHRDELDPMDEARAIRRFMRVNKLATYAQAAVRLNHSLGWVTTRIALLDLSEEDQEAVSSGKLPMYAAAKKSRAQTGNTRKSKGKRAAAEEYFDEMHPLASRARARCRAHGPKKALPGGVACGECWETIIRHDSVTQMKIGHVTSNGRAQA